MTTHATARVHRFLVFAAIVTVATLGHARAAGAQQIVPEGHFTATPFLGFGFSGDLDGAAGAIGAAGGYAWSPRISLEGEWTLLPSNELGGLVEVDSRTWSLTGNILYHFTERPFVPYGVIGIGFGRASLDVDPGHTVPGLLETSSTEFVVNFGVGVQRQLRGRMAFRGDLRYFFGSNLVPDYWRMSAGLTFDLGGF